MENTYIYDTIKLLTYSLIILTGIYILINNYKKASFVEKKIINPDHKIRYERAELNLSGMGFVTPNRFEEKCVKCLCDAGYTEDEILPFVYEFEAFKEDVKKGVIKQESIESILKQLICDNFRVYL